MAKRLGGGIAVPVYQARGQSDPFIADGDYVLAKRRAAG